MTNIITILLDWTGGHPEFRLGARETELREWEEWRDLQVEVWRDLDAAVWRVEDLPPKSGARCEPPVLGVMVARHLETEGDLRKQVHWYLLSGVEVVWLVLPDAMVVTDAVAARRYGLSEQLPPHRFVPGLEPRMFDLFCRLET